MTSQQAYQNYLTRTKKTEALINKKLDCYHAFQATGQDIASITPQAIEAFIQPDNADCRAGQIKNRNEFFIHFATFIEKEHPPLADTAATIRQYFHGRFEGMAKKYVAHRKAMMLPMPAHVPIDPQHLTDISQEDFLAAFAQWRQVVASGYDRIAEDPFAWGYPDYITTEGTYNRLIDILFAIVFCGTHHQGRITVDTKAFFSSQTVKRHKKPERMVSGLTEMGFVFENFSKKSPSFHVTFPANPHVMTAMYAYINQMPPHQQSWQYALSLQSLSHRFVEDPATQSREAMFLAELDYDTPQLQEMKHWLYDQATKYGFAIDTHAWEGGGAIQFVKGSKKFLSLKQGTREPGTNHFSPHKTKIGTKVSFIHAFAKAPEKMRQLCNRFPHVFRLEDPGTCCNDRNPEKNPHQFADKSEKSGKRCAFVMKFALDGVAYKRCGLGNFFFEDIGLEDLKVILEMFLVEKRIK